MERNISSATHMVKLLSSNPFIIFYNINYITDTQYLRTAENKLLLKNVKLC